MRYHVDVLRENDCVVALGNEDYGVPYSLSPHLQSHFEDFKKIWRRLELWAELGEEKNSHRSMETA
jgi:hypothetical protein